MVEAWNARTEFLQASERDGEKSNKVAGQSETIEV